MKKFFAIAALVAGLLPGIAAAQSVPTMEGGSWVMPTQERSAAPAAQGGSSYVDMVYEICANEGCHVSPETMIRVIDCETGGTWDHGVVGPNGELGILQIDPRYHSEAYGSPYQQIEYAAQHLGNDVYWACL